MKKAFAIILLAAITLSACTPNESSTQTETVLPETTTDKSFVWTSSDESIATVDKYGVVTAVSSGTVNIIATSLDEGGVSGVISVTVK